MMYKDGEFKEGKSRSDFDMTKIGETWVGFAAMSKEERDELIKNNNPFTVIKMGTDEIISGNLKGVKKVKFE